MSTVNVWGSILLHSGAEVFLGGIMIAMMYVFYFAFGIFTYVAIFVKIVSSRRHFQRGSGAGSSSRFVYFFYI